MPRRRTVPQSLGSVISKVYPADEPEQLQAIRAFRWWDKVVPPRVARNARPVRLRAGILTIHVANSTWAQELSYLRPQLLASVQRGAPDAKVKDLQIRVGELPQIVRRTRVPPEGKLKPLAAAELPDELARALARIGDNALREVITAAAATSLASEADRDRKTRKIIRGAAE